MANKGIMNYWSRKWDCCQLCQENSRRHSAHGFCTTCIQIVYDRYPQLLTNDLPKELYMERLKHYAAERPTTSKAHIRAIRRKYCQRNRERISAYQKAWYAKKKTLLAQKRVSPEISLGLVGGLDQPGTLTDISCVSNEKKGVN